MSTIMEEARRGVTPLIKEIAKKEGVSEEFVRNGIASGRICVPCNPVHDPTPGAIGEGMSVKINVNLDSSGWHDVGTGDAGSVINNIVR